MKTTSGRVMRVFISSTFRDMFEEREQLEKFVFPKLRAVCREHRIFFSDVDLRWGVTEEQVKSGELLPTCFAEIEACNYFIGILGERYGTTAQKFMPHVLDQYPWLAAYEDRSYTELEMLYAVLNSPRRIEQAFFYFRSPDHPQSKTHGAADEQERHKQAALKQSIEVAGVHLRENYQSAEQFAEWITEDLQKAIEQDFTSKADRSPDEDPLSDMDEQLRGFVVRPAVMSQLDDFLARTTKQLDLTAQDTNVILALIGPSGNGKSALLVNWVAAHPQHKVAAVFIGSRPETTQPDNILGGLIRQLEHLFGLQPPQEELVLSPHAKLVATLTRASHLGSVVLILDGLDKLDNEAQNLLWLPNPLPANVHLIIASRECQAVEILRQRTIETLVLPALSTDEKRAIATAYLELYGKRLDTTLLSKVISASQTESPLFLQVLLNDLRLFALGTGQPVEWLQLRIDENLTAQTVDDLFERILARFETDYGHQRPDLVKETVCALWAAHQGLSEDELLDFLSHPTSIVWSPFFAALRELLVNRGGLYTLAYSDLFQAIQDRYLPQASEQQAAYQNLAAFFARRSLDERQVIELPHLYTKLAAWDALYNWIAVPQNFSLTWLTDRLLVKTIWKNLEDHSSYRMSDAYRAIIDEPEKYGHIESDRDFKSVADDVGLLLAELGHVSEAQLLRSRQEKNLRQEQNYYRLIPILNELGLTYLNKGQYADAMRAFNEKLRYCQQKGDPLWLSTTFGNIGLIALVVGDYMHALMNLQEQERIERGAISLFDSPDHQLSHGNASSAIGDVLYIMDEITAALEFNSDALESFRRANARPHYAAALVRRGRLYLELKRWNEAQKDFQTALSLLEDVQEVEALKAQWEALMGLGRALERLHEKKIVPVYTRAVEVAKRLQSSSRYVESYVALVRFGATLGGEAFIEGEPNIRQLAQACFTNGSIESLARIYDVLGSLQVSRYSKRFRLSKEGYQAALVYFANLEKLYQQQKTTPTPLSIQHWIKSLEGQLYVLTFMKHRAIQPVPNTDYDRDIPLVSQKLARARHAVYETKRAFPKAHQAIRLGQIEQANSILNRVQKYADILEGSSEWSLYTQLRGSLFELQGYLQGQAEDCETAFDSFNRAADIYREAGIPHAELRMIREVARMHQKMTDLDYPNRNPARADELTHLMEQIISKYESHPWFETSDFGVLALLIQNQASFLFQKQDWLGALSVAQKSERYQRLALEMWPETSEQGLGFSLWIQGVGYEETGDLEMAVRCFTHAIERFSPYRDELEEYLSACEMRRFRLLLEIDFRNGFDKSQLKAFETKNADTFRLFDQGDLPKALEILNEMEAKAEALHSRAWKYQALMGQVVIYQNGFLALSQAEDNETALWVAEEMLACYEIMDESYGILNGKIFMAQILQRMTRYQDAVALLDEAEQGAQQGLYRVQQRNIQRQKRGLLTEWIKVEKANGVDTIRLEDLLKAVPDPDRIDQIRDL